MNDKPKMDYMHPLVLLQTEIDIRRNTIADARYELDSYKEELREKFKQTLLYKELIQTAQYVQLLYIDEDITEILVIDNLGDSSNLELNSQEVKDKL